MGRSPCCDKMGLKKGPWTSEEDEKLLAYIEEHGHGSWRSLPEKAGLHRCGKSCRLRWTNYLRPDIKRGKFNLQEEQTIIQLHALLGNRWSAIATHLPKRTDNEIKNYWNTHLKKRLVKMGIDPVTHKPQNETPLSSLAGGLSKNASTLSHMAQWESARLEAEARLARESKLLHYQTKVSSSASHHHLNIISSSDESPTSTVSFSEAKTEFVGSSSSSTCLNMIKEAENDWISSTIHEFEGGVEEEGLTGLLLGSGGDSLGRSFSADKNETAGESSGGGGGDCNGYYEEDNKNYLDSIFSFVDPSPSDSTPMF